MKSYFWMKVWRKILGPTLSSNFSLCYQGFNELFSHSVLRTVTEMKSKAKNDAYSFIYKLMKEYLIHILFLEGNGCMDNWFIINVIIDRTIDGKRERKWFKMISFSIAICFSFPSKRNGTKNWNTLETWLQVKTEHIISPLYWNEYIKFEF